jgi:hypothetical protein
LAKICAVQEKEFGNRVNRARDERGLQSACKSDASATASRFFAKALADPLPRIGSTSWLIHLRYVVRNKAAAEPTAESE